MYVECISGEVQKSLELVGQTPLAEQFYLAGGTAVALHLGHRRSYDADPMPEMLKPVSWPDVRRFFDQEAQRLFREL